VAGRGTSIPCCRLERRPADPPGRRCGTAGDLEAGEVVRGAASPCCSRTRWNLRRSRPSAGADEPASLRGPRRGARSAEIERTPHPGNIELLTQARDRIQHRRAGACACECPGASGGCPRPRCAAPAPVTRLHADLAPRHGRDQLRHGERQRLAGDERLSADQDQVAADVRAKGFTRQAQGVLERRAVAIRVVAVRMPWRCASTMPWFTSGVKPKSSALTTSCFRSSK